MFVYVWVFGIWGSIFIYCFYFFLYICYTTYIILSSTPTFFRILPFLPFGVPSAHSLPGVGGQVVGLHTRSHYQRHLESAAERYKIYKMYKMCKTEICAKLYGIVLTKCPGHFMLYGVYASERLQICTKHRLTQNLFSQKDFFHAMGNTIAAKFIFFATNSYLETKSS